MPTPPADLPSLAPASAPLADLPSLAPAPLADLPSLSGSIAVSFFSLGVVCLVAFVALRWLGRRSPRMSSGPMRVLARQSLDQKRSVFVIEAAQRCFLVGAGEGSMTLLAELDKAAVERDLARTAPRPGPAGRLFAEVLAKVLQKPTAARPSTLTPAATPQREEADHAVGS
jgi:flagellar biosynthetic protein FliO